MANASFSRRQFLITSGTLAVGGLLPSAASATAAERADKLHVLFVCDARARKIGEGMLTNFQKMKEVFSEVWENRTDRFMFDEFRYDGVNPSSILNFYHNASFDDGESILFYYCGHGGWDAEKNGIDGNERGHFLAMSGGNRQVTRSRKKEC